MRKTETKLSNRPPEIALRVTIALFACLLGWLVGSHRASAQDNPHGDLSIDCSRCHSTEGWTPLREPLEFEHAQIGFPLEKGHQGVDCLSCHTTLVFGFVATACADCHDDPHRGELGFDCEICHTPSSWDSRRTLSDFHSATLFPLTGTHATVDCAGCHRREPPFEYALTPTDCFSCHMGDYQGTRDPNHVAAGFPTDCQLCHDTLEWEGADFGGGFGFDHSVLFQLTGAHAALDCEDCHVSGFAGTPSACVACHRADYDATRDPDHRQAGFGTDCENCHGTSTWEGAVTDHSAIFPLTGAHRALDCADCHTSGFAGTPSDCVACHRAEYDATTDPNHRAAGFPRDCEVCHNTNSWSGADFNHSFPIFSGPHREGQAWDDCSDCHPNSNNFSIFDCTACHSRSEMNEEHDDVNGYVYNSVECLACHPDGREDD